MILIQAIPNGMVNDLVVRNVADLAAVPAGLPGRPSRSLNLEQARAVLDAAKGERLWPLHKARQPDSGVINRVRLIKRQAY